MPDVVVTVPMSFGLLDWIDEGDPAGAPWSGEEWDFYLAGARPNIKRGERVYVVYNGALRGYAPLLRLDTAATSFYVRRRGEHAFSLVRGGGAVALTIPEYIQGFRGWRYRWWERSIETLFPNWQDPNALAPGVTRPARPQKAQPARQAQPTQRAAAMSLWDEPTPTPAPTAEPTVAAQADATRVVHCRKAPFDIYIGRPMPRYPELKASGWGNPYRESAMSDDGRRLSPIDRYREWLMGQPRLLARLPELRGKALGCWCAPVGGLPGSLYGHVCHGEVLAALADGTVIKDSMASVE